MNFIVFDLEWNQSPLGKKYENKRLPFEIIEIGAVKLNEKRENIGNFQRMICPQIYKRIHEAIHDIIHVDYRDLKNGDPFPKACEDFLKWCGEDYIFCTWGNQDVMELQRNLKFYEMLPLLPGPVRYMDVQKLYGLFVLGDKSKVALNKAAMEQKIEAEEDFHRALSDAMYTAKVFQKIDLERAKPYFSIDVYQNPQKRKDQINISYPTYDKFVSREFEDRDKIMNARDVTVVYCPVCHLMARRRLRWFSYNTKNYFSISNCKEHGAIKGKIRIRKTEEEKYYVVKTTRLINEEEILDIQKKKEAVLQRRKNKRGSS